MIEPIAGMPFVRVSVPGYREKVFGDITHRESWPVRSYLVAYDGVLQIKPPNWLTPEGSSGEKMFRWLSSKGAFELFATYPSQIGMVRLNIYPGPDLLPENSIEIQINGVVLRTFKPKDLPLRLDLPVANLNPGGNKCAVEVLGPVGGIRQVGVGNMSVLPLIK